MDFDPSLITALVIGYFAGKCAYWWGYKDGVRDAVDDLQDAALKLKELGERAYAEAKRHV